VNAIGRTERVAAKRPKVGILLAHPPPPRCYDAPKVNDRVKEGQHGVVESGNDRRPKARDAQVDRARPAPLLACHDLEYTTEDLVCTMARTRFCIQWCGVVAALLARSPKRSACGGVGA